MSDAAAASLSAFELLDGVPEPELAELARIMRRREARAGQVLWRQGDESRELVFVLDGRVSISLQLPGDATVEVSSVGPGQVMGEMGVIDGGPRPVTAIAAEPTTMLLRRVRPGDLGSRRERRHRGPPRRVRTRVPRPQARKRDLPHLPRRTVAARRGAGPT